MEARKYSCKDVDMLMASSIISQEFTNNITDLATVRTNWTAEYAADLATRIDSTIATHLGVDKKKTQRDATASLHAIQAPAMRDLAFLKSQILVDFPAESKEMLKTLGFDLLPQVQSRNQEALIQMLFAFKSGMTDALKTQIVEKGTSPALIDKIIDYADKMKNAEVHQEVEKEGTKGITAEAQKAFSDIYDEIIGICKIASKYYQHEPLKKELFTFSTVVDKLSGKSKSTQKEDE